MSVLDFNVLHNAIKYFPQWYSEPQELRMDGLSRMMSRPSDDIPLVSGGWRTGSPVERFIIEHMCSEQVRQLDCIVTACIRLYHSSSPVEQVLLWQCWRGKHTDMLPEPLLTRFHSLLYDLPPSPNALAS